METSNAICSNDQHSVIKNSRNLKRRSIKFYNGAACRYPVVRAAAARLGWKLIDEDSSEKAKRSCNVLWIDTSNVQNYFLTIQPWQRINHFPGMTNIARKTRLAENLEMMKKGFEQEYAFFPTTFILPRDLSSIKEYFGSSGRSKHTFIVKPDGGCQGKGIFLTKSLNAIEDLKTTHVAQHYIPNPLLIEGKKFDLRIYVLITSCAPLRIYLFQDGLVRLCTEDFIKPNSSNMDDMCMHLTNYSINRKSKQFEGSDDKSGDSGSKRSIKWLLSWLSEQRSPACADALWEEISEISVKTILSISPTLLREYQNTFGISGGGESYGGSHDSNDNQHHYEKDKSEDSLIRGSRCFAILGVDVMVDSDLKSHMIEVNHLPSFATNSPLDETIKSKVCYQALSALKCESSDQYHYEVLEKKRRGKRLHGSSNRCNDHDDMLDGNDNNDGTNSVAGVESHKNIEQKIIDIYSKHAPEKIEKIDTLLEKYRGYEEWLIRRLEEKYCTPFNSIAEGKCVDCDDGIVVGTRLGEQKNESNTAVYDDIELLEESKLLVEDGDYIRIYPPVGKNRNKIDLYLKMQDYAGEHDAKEQKRLTCPMWLQRQNTKIESDIDSSAVCDQDASTPSRGDWMFHGNVHIQKKNIPTKILQPPSQKQIEAAERLTKGHSVEDRKYQTDAFIPCNTMNESFVNKIAKAEEAGKQWRSRNEAKHIPKTRLQMKPINLEFVDMNINSNNALGYDEGERYYVDFAGRKLGMK